MINVSQCVIITFEYNRLSRRHQIILYLMTKRIFLVSYNIENQQIIFRNIFKFSYVISYRIINRSC